jgi:hypothetical protein
MAIENKSSSTGYPLENVRSRNTIIMISIFIIFLYLFNNILYAYTPYIPDDQTRYFWLFLKDVYAQKEAFVLTNEFINCFWAVNLFLLSGVFGYFTFLIFWHDLYRKMVLTLISLSGILALWVIYRIFPFNLSSRSSIIFVELILIFIMTGVITNIARIWLKSKTGAG